MYSRALRRAAKVTQEEVAKLLRPDHKLIRKITVSMVENPEAYGVRFIKEAEEKVLQYLDERTAIPGKKKDRHRLKHRVMMRMSESSFVEFEQLREKAGFATNQGFLEYLYHLYREGRREECVSL